MACGRIESKSSAIVCENAPKKAARQRTVVGPGSNESGGGCVTNADWILCALMHVRGVQADVSEHRVPDLKLSRLQPACAQHCMLRLCIVLHEHISQAAIRSRTPLPHLTGCKERIVIHGALGGG